MTTLDTGAVTAYTAPVVEAEPPFDGVLVVKDGQMSIDPAVREWVQALAVPK